MEEIYQILATPATSVYKFIEVGARGKCISWGSCEKCGSVLVGELGGGG
jgi:hypothetical protein